MVYYSFVNNFCSNNLFQSPALACIQLCWSDRLMRKMMMVQTVWWDNMFQLLQVCSGKYTKENENNCYTSSQVTLRYPRSGIVKLHSDLRILTQLQLVGVGVDFVFPLEGRRRKKEEVSNPHLALSRRNDPACLVFSDCLVGVWRVYGNCLECLVDV